MELCIFYKEWIFHCRDLHRVTVLIFPVQDWFDCSKAILIFWSQNRSYSICVIENGCRMMFVSLNRTFCPLILSLGTVSFSFYLLPPDVEHAWAWGAGLGRQASSSSLLRSDGLVLPLCLCLFAPWWDGCSDPLYLKAWGRADVLPTSPHIGPRLLHLIYTDV